MVIGETFLVGSRNIPEQAPALIREGLAAGGLPLPDFPGVETIRELMGQVPEEEVRPEILPTPSLALPTATPD